jgi:hypothetical protein
MLFIDMTAQLAPIAYGLCAFLAVGVAALFSSALGPVIGARLHRERPRLVLAQPALAGHGTR